MQKFVIEGGHPLKGEVSISGSKNAAVAVICGAILTDGICRIENLPKIKDVYVILDILTKLGAKITTLPDSSVIIDPTNINTYTATFDMVRKMRGSYYLLGSLLGRFSRANVSMPGGCNFGTRPIDQHIKGFVSLGADINIVHGIIEAKAEELVGNHIFLDIVSVGATINIMLAAAKAKGVTTIENAAKEPHVVDLANFLNAMGANIKGAGTDTIKITGVDHMPGGTYTIIPDQIEAGTFMIAAAAIGEDVLVKNLIPKHMESLTAKL
ncbi:MAG: UDP-N-acetylglucosamine 1-carboxyvinyltransferase, partial [Clostridiaceae bacterium]|nr:UDP-N-acetylglucosamine 1-carboxyvinyltransferase [Clostridiaceae bacterium]